MRVPRLFGVGRSRASGDKGGRLRAIRRRSASRAAPISINLAPMIDVTFLLLIFFLVTTTFERAEGLLTSDMPRTSLEPAVALPISPIVIRLTQISDDHDDYAISIDHFKNVPQRLEKLPGFLLEIHRQPGFDGKTPVVIVAENRVRWDHVVSCWNAALRAGCESIAFAEP